MPVIRLRSHEERRLRAGHLWAYSNEIDTAQTPIRGMQPGSLVRLEDSRGKPLGIATFNPHTLLALRLLTPQADATIDAEWLLRRLQMALAARSRWYPTPHYRLVFGESDGLPGLVIDRFDRDYVVQITTAGMEALKPQLIAAMQKLLSPASILFRNDTAMRQTEGLPADDDHWGNLPESFGVQEAGLNLALPAGGGQKTGWYYDQTANRDLLARYTRGARVLDVFSYMGGWALRALAAGATDATCVDASEPALSAAKANAERNGMTLGTIKGDALDVLKRLKSEGRQFDIVIVDPPALIKRKKDEEAGQAHYAALSRAAMALLPEDGVLVSCSCSHHLAEDQLQRILLREARSSHRRLQILQRGEQGPDHPVHPAINETRYLKAFFCRVSSA